VIGPSDKLYVLDRRDWICALAAEGVHDVSVLALKDLARHLHADMQDEQTGEFQPLPDNLMQVESALTPPSSKASSTTRPARSPSASLKSWRS
jgi:hypothetical protein